MEDMKKLEMIFKVAVVGVCFSFAMALYTGYRDAQALKAADQQVGTIPAPAF